MSLRKRVEASIAGARAALGRNWLSVLLLVLAGDYLFLGVVAWGSAGLLGLGAGVVIGVALFARTRAPLVSRLLFLACGIPFAALTWWSVVTPILALLTAVLGWLVTHPRIRIRARQAAAVSVRADVPSVQLQP